MRRIVLGFLPVAVAIFASCSVESVDSQNEPDARNADQPIISGTLDTVNDATVAVGESFGNQYGIFCSGSIIARNGSTGYVLTAAHCVQGQNPNFIVVGDDHNCASTGTCLATYDVTAENVHPDYDGAVDSPNDIAVLTFTGANASTPVAPVAGSADTLAIGDVLELSGYGKTVTGFNNNDDNTERRHVSVAIADLGFYQMLFDQSGPTHAGSCQGDSGGPAYKVINGTKTVVGVTSYGDQDCEVAGVYVRASAHYNSFIAPIIGGQVMETCDTCFQASINTGGACEPTVNACFDDASCNALATCLQECPANDQTCVNNCAAANPNGIDKYNAIFDCTICQDCAALCDTSGCGMETTVAVSVTSGGVTSSVVTSADATTAAGAGGATGEGGAGATTGSGGGKKKKKPEPTSESTVTCDCTVGAPASSDDAWRMIGLSAMAAAFLIRRRRR